MSTPVISIGESSPRGNKLHAKTQLLLSTFKNDQKNACNIITLSPSIINNKVLKKILKLEN